jgi:hypothetical protein
MIFQHDSNASLIRKLRSVGYSCFVKYLPLFEGRQPSYEAAAYLEEKECFTAPASRTRVSNARSILASGQRDAALRVIAEASKVPEAVREAARTALTNSP